MPECWLEGQGPNMVAGLDRVRPERWNTVRGGRVGVGWCQAAGGREVARRWDGVQLTPRHPLAASPVPSASMWTARW